MKLELEIDQPVDVSFTYAEGKLCSKKWPNQEDSFMRGTTDGHIMFFSESEETRLRGMVRARQAVRITKRKTTGGACWLQMDSVPAELPAAPPRKPATAAVVQPVKQEDTLLARCLMDAIDAVQVAQRYAVDRGLPVAFGAGEIERIGIAVFIARTRDAAVIAPRSTRQA
jgi:hypothetical protein